MVSMTGFAYREKTGENISISVEIKGYNNRYLEISANFPPWLSHLESKVREKISRYCTRGKIDVYIRIREHNVPVDININKNAAKALYNAIDELANELKIIEKPTLSMLLNLDNLHAGNLQSGGIFEIEKKRDEELYWNEIEPVLNEVIQAFCLEREREGKYTETDIMANLEKIETSVKFVSSYVPEIEKTLKENIIIRFEELLGNKIDENRILTETASLLIKYTISEEISRLSSHLSEFRAENSKNKSPGKKLDFLCQEIHRETNTIGSKSGIFEVSNEVVKMKEALENIREQLRNIE
ncbi:MAG: YicC family protein [Treponema sp.]|jgi:uncharacterized protein (TIGR00255 family)|nr:YicC family protein [Treponema sp.]